MNRCKIKPAYSRSPAERLHGWIQGHLLRLLATALACAAIWFLVDYLLVSILNVLGEAAAWDTENKQTFATGAPLVQGIKIACCALGAWLLLCRCRVK